MWKGAFCFIAFGTCALSSKWLWQVFCFHYFYYPLNQQNSLSLSYLIMQPVRGRTYHVIVPMATELFCIILSRELHRPHTNKHMHADTHTHAHRMHPLPHKCSSLSLNKHTLRHVHCWKSGCWELWMKQYCNLNLYGTFPLWVQPMNYPLQ